MLVNSLCGISSVNCFFSSFELRISDFVDPVPKAHNNKMNGEVVNV